MSRIFSSSTLKHSAITRTISSIIHHILSVRASSTLPMMASSLKSPPTVSQTDKRLAVESRLYCMAVMAVITICKKKKLRIRHFPRPKVYLILLEGLMRSLSSYKRYYKSTYQLDDTRIQDDYSGIGTEFCDFLANVLTFRLIKAFDGEHLRKKHTHKNKEGKENQN